MTDRPTNYSGLVFWEVTRTFFEKNPLDAYCRMQASPKVEKVRERFETTVEEA